MKTLFIAEAGVNHNGNLNLAKKMIIIAKESGADFIKFQTFDAKNLTVLNAKKAPYQAQNTHKKKETQYLMLKKYQLSIKDHYFLIKECKKNKINFLSSPFDIPSIKLVKKLKLKYIKIPSGEITNFSYLEEVGKLKKRIILSTGMSNLKEIKEALKILISNGTKKKDITVMHCHTAYPTYAQNVNMKAMLTIKKKLNINIGYSDHTVGPEASLLAVSLGAKIIEKHFTTNRKLAGPDHLASSTPGELKQLIISIKKIEKMIGSEVKIATAEERKNIKIVRKSIYAKKSILKGDRFNKRNIIALRPERGISANKWFNLLKIKSKKNYEPGYIIE